MTVKARVTASTFRAGAVREEALEVFVLDPHDDAWPRNEREMAEFVSLPFGYRSVVARSSIVAPTRLIVALDRAGSCRGAVAVELLPARRFPGHLVARARRFGPTVPVAARNVLCRALADMVRGDARILRVNVEVFSRDAEERAGLGEALLRSGFVPVLDQNCYSHTLALDLHPAEDRIFAGIDSSARRNVRSVTKNPVIMRTVAERELASRLDSLEREAMERSGGSHVPADWGSRIEFSERHPQLSRIVGLFHAGTEGPDALLAFAWAVHNGSHAVYTSAACTRRTGLKVPMTYPLMWDLIAWARRTGASWFDLGGVTAGTLGDTDDRLGGISDFKRTFSKNVVEVGEEYELRAPTLRSRASHWLQRALQPRT